MKPERWLQIEELCQAALDQTGEQRASFLNSRCAGNEALRLEVESLLRYQEPASNFIETPALEVAAKAAAADQARPLIGQQMSHYRTLSLLGAGGMGKVYLAEDINLNRRIALKLLPSEFTRNAGRVRRFKQEALALSALNHPNIVTIYEIGEAEQTHYIATEFIDGQTLRQQMNNEMIPLRSVIDVAAQVASALAVAHDSGVVHRDIKPENIMVRKDGLVKVLDFGLAKVAEAEAADFDPGALKNEAVNTETGALMGTVRYMSPEQARGLTLDARSDIFSLGVVLHEMLSGKSTFAGVTTAEVIAAIFAKEPPPITQYRSEAPEALDELKRILTLSLQKERAERYQTAREMLADLKRVKQRLEIEAELKRNSATSGGLDHVTTAEENAVETAARPTISAENRSPVEPYGKAESEGLAPPHKTTAVTWKLTAVMATLVLVFISTWMFLRNRPGAPASVAAIRSLAILPLGRESVDLQAYDLYVQGGYFVHKRTKASIQKGIDNYQQAIQRDPKYAAAYAAMARAYGLGYLPKEEECSKMRDLAGIALKLDKGLAEAHAALATRLYECDWDWAGAEREFQRAIALNPDDALTHAAYGQLLMALGRREEWTAEKKRAGELDPLSLVTTGAVRYLESGQPDLYIERFRQVMQLDPSSPHPYGMLGSFYTSKGMYEDAINNLKKAVELSKGGPGHLSALGYTYGVFDKRKEALEILDQLTRSNAEPELIAKVCLGLGEKDRAFYYLQKAVADHSIHPPSLRSKELDSIKSDLRYAELLRRMGLPP